MVVCAGNICRSPMAAALLERLLRGPRDAVVVESAGLTALSGHGADPHAVSVMSERGVDIRAHRARQLASWMLAGADLVLVMDSPQKRALVTRFPSLLGRVYLLGELAGSRGLPGSCEHGFDIPDPYRKDRASFEHSLTLIEAGVAAWAARIASLSRSADGGKPVPVSVSASADDATSSGLLLNT